MQMKNTYLKPKKNLTLLILVANLILVSLALSVVSEMNVATFIHLSGMFILIVIINSYLFSLKQLELEVNVDTLDIFKKGDFIESFEYEQILLDDSQWVFTVADKYIFFYGVMTFVYPLEDIKSLIDRLESSNAVEKKNLLINIYRTNKYMKLFIWSFIVVIVNMLVM